MNAISDDSRQVQPGGIFVAVRGVEHDGHDYLDAAARAGAAVAIVEAGSEGPPGAVPRIVVRDGRRAAAVAAAAFYGDPAKGLNLIGVTGTNGKTTTVGILRHLFDTEPGLSASIGTLGVLVGSNGVQLAGGGSLTTPGPIELQRVLRALVDTGARTVTMEVSSHALHQHRVDGIRFAVAVFTNLTRDHLDYHGTMESYVAAKLSLLEHLAPGGVAVYNADDPAWGVVAAAANRRSFSARSANADVTARDVHFAQRGSSWTLRASGESYVVGLPLIGEFNVANALAAAAAAQATGLDLGIIARRLSSVPQVPGRLEILADHPTILRDYAHTPDALERALAALRPFTPGALIVVFGAGGDRDRGKRPLMAQIADRLADRVIVTSDNPRTEDPERIIDEIVAPLAPGRYERIEDRGAAIARAIAMADAARDVVLLAGKGHETYQVRGTTKLPFDEREIVGTLLRARTRAASGT
ncbi:MAG TPA: UDP-N-acetylmuramoyl-L-alanyl-D-glutamate--2,6-diaminopimelate ligase [Gemmatimonadaceae bacterium]|nr:UDP-N-acetylmuramoyl-L-alanyl-D-glutamate--2,6-diaminopimelate ligase [Gemmatimonadaceae bacterium]